MADDASGLRFTTPIAQHHYVEVWERDTLIMCCFIYDIHSNLLSTFKSWYGPQQSLQMHHAISQQIFTGKSNLRYPSRFSSRNDRNMGFLDLLKDQYPKRSNTTVQILRVIRVLPNIDLLPGRNEYRIVKDIVAQKSSEFGDKSQKAIRPEGSLRPSQQFHRSKSPSNILDL